MRLQKGSKCVAALAIQYFRLAAGISCQKCAECVNFAHIRVICPGGAYSERPPRVAYPRYLALLIKTREQSVPRAENANRPALKGSPSNMAEMAVRRLEENAVRRNRLELVEPVVAVFCR